MKKVDGYSIFSGTIADMTWMEVEEAAEKKAIMLVPLGVIEQHGPHLPLATDIYGAHLMCTLIKNELYKECVTSVIAPPYYFGINSATFMFPGSISIRQETMISILTDFFLNYKKHGFSKQFILNHHGDPQHNSAIFQAVLDAREHDVEAVCVMRPSTQRAYEKLSVPLPPSAIISLSTEESGETKQARARLNKSDLHIHAEERETSLIMRWYPELLRKQDEIKSFIAVIPSAEEFEKAEAGGTWRELSPLGYIGDPSVATPDNGELYAYEARDIAIAITKHLKK